ncbi:MAG: hypothetical protein MJ169_09475, partial [Treponema sp.]|nr:hypothetical protein [Treponema sp.]
MQIIQLLLINRSWAFIRLVKARSPSATSLALTQPFSGCLISSYTRHPLQKLLRIFPRLFFLFSTNDMQILKLLFVYWSWAFVH